MDVVGKSQQKFKSTIRTFDNILFLEEFAKKPEEQNMDFGKGLERFVTGAKI